ncbi:hypothetical protein ACFYSC_08645 [Streptosporangium sp. NPDC004379]|uniref:fascin domain-containing protein n=1 Tax=Streptosporangium sp. NPDC004379 TaxID=3366189 RepID=UPI00369E9508
MRRLVRSLVAGCAAALVVAAPTPAHAAGAPPSGAGQRFALLSQANGLYVSAEADDPGTDEGILRARGGLVKSWEQFTLVDAGSGLYALRAKANGLYVTAEKDYAGGGAGMLRARASSIGSWERYRLVPIGQLVSGTAVAAQKVCVPDVNNVDRGSYGIALAVPDVNT